MYNKFYRGFDPIWSGHKKDIPTLTKYLSVTSRTYYLAALLLAWYTPFFLKLGLFEQPSALSFLSLVPFFIVPAVLMYLFQVYRQYWYLAPAMSVKAKIVKYLFGLWMIVFLLINIAQIIFPSLAVNERLFSIWGLSVTFSWLAWIVNIIWGIVGELLLGVIKKQNKIN